MDGAVLGEVLTTDRPVQYVGVEAGEAEGVSSFDYTEAERMEIAERLRHLGYMD